MGTQTLGQYFKELREAVRPYPLLDREAVEAMSDEGLKTLLVERRWGVPHHSRFGKASRESWVRHFFKAQAAKNMGLSLAEIARRTGFDIAAIWKIEHDKPILGETLRRALVEGLGLKADSAEVRRALALWTTARSSVKIEGKELAEVQRSASFNQFLQQAVPVLAGLSPRDYDAVLEALSNPSIVEALPAMCRVAAEAKKPAAPKLRVVSPPKR